MKADLNALMKQIKMLTLEDQRSLNSLLVANLRHASKINNIEKAAAFDLGDTVTFDTPKGNIVIKVEGFSRDRSKVKGTQINDAFRSRAGTKWQASAALCKIQSAK